MNVLSIVGNVTADVDLNYSKEGKAYAHFTVAVPREFKRDETDFLRVTVFNAQAENCAKFVQKGSKVGVVGSVQIERRDDKYFTNVIARSVEFLTPKGSGGNNSQQSNQSNAGYKDDPFANDGKPIDISDDDLPF